MEFLSQEEALRFVAEVLKIGDPEEKMKNSRLLFLEQLIKAYHEKIPFHNIHLLNMKPEQRHVPTWAEIKSRNDVQLWWTLLHYVCIQEVPTRCTWL